MSSPTRIAVPAPVPSASCVFDFTSEGAVSEVKKVVLMTGTRADWGKVKRIAAELEKSEFFKLHIFVTGMHMMRRHGRTSAEVRLCLIISRVVFFPLFSLLRAMCYALVCSILCLLCINARRSGH
jgi:hypothetical protein